MPKLDPFNGSFLGRSLLIYATVMYLLVATTVLVPGIHFTYLAMARSAHDAM